MRSFVLILFLFSYSFLNAQVSVKSYGAKGDGYTDDAGAIQAALNSGNKTITFEAGKIYRTSKPLLTPSYVTIVGNKATLKPTSTFTTYSHPVIGNISRVNFKQENLSISVKKGYSTFYYPNAYNLKVGYIVLLQGPYYVMFGSQGYKYGLYAIIRSISGNTVTLDRPSTHSFTAKSVILYETLKNVSITSINVDLRGRKTGFGIGMSNVINGTITDCFVQSDPTTTSAEVGINATGMNIKILRNKVRNFRLGSDVGYGINVGGHSIFISQNDVAVARHCITSAGRDYMSTNVEIVNNIANSGSGSAPIDFHANANGRIDSNTVISTTPNIVGIMIRNSNTSITGNHITFTNASGTFVYGIGLDEKAYENIKVYRNSFFLKGVLKSASFISNFGIKDTMRNIVIRNNYSQGHVQFTATMTTGIKIDSNTFEGSSTFNPSINLKCPYIKEYQLVGNTFINNFGDDFNYSILTPTYNGSTGSIKGNKVYCNNTANASTQFRVNNRHNSVGNNSFHTRYVRPLGDFSSDKQNYMSGNVIINSSGSTTLITYTVLPKATSYFYGKTILFKDSNGVTNYYTCVKITSTTYSWQKKGTYTS